MLKANLLKPYKTFLRYERHKVWYWQNRDHVLEGMRTYWKRKGDWIKERRKFYNIDQENKKRYAREYKRVWNVGNKEKVLQYRVVTERKRSKDPGRRTYCRELSRRKAWELRLSVLAHLGGKCAECGCMDFRCLQVDHLHGNGTKELKTVRLSRRYKKILLSKPGDEYQLLCANCNWIKRWELREYHYESYMESWDEDKKVRYLQERRAYRRVRTETVNALGGKCVLCGFADYSALQIDHVVACGTKGRSPIRLGWLKCVSEDRSGKYQLLCANCNWIKRHEMREYVQKKESA